ncbi:MAG TPA: LuxR C-terminal-related transcriptional regulator [Herpetosiphonaceae bacterium]|nr:LuxR C-terminal-related transcriptional regulator [Herpetosiphonaceae bacterium]
MPTPILATKLYIPPPRPNSVPRPRLIERLDAGLDGKLTLLSAAAGFGKTTLLSAWLAGSARPAAWLALDEGDSDPGRFLAGLVAALRTIAPGLAFSALGLLGSPQPALPEAILAALLNDIAAIPEHFTLVLDDYHALDSRPVDQAMAVLLERMPPQMHLVIATREDPDLPVARLRGRGQLTELRVTDLRFTRAEAAGFLNQAMGLKLSADDIAALESRTEGWIAGLQLAALSMQRQPDAAGFIASFTGSHHFVMDYLLEEVLHQQPPGVQAFLLGTAVLDRLCGPLCDAVLADPATPGQATLEYLEHANLFIIPLDNERRWYRYHHLFADLLRQRLQQGAAGLAADELHGRASRWYEANGLEIEAFQHAAAANDIARAERLIEGRGMPLHFRGVLLPVLNWLKGLPSGVLDSRPALWTTYASVLLATGQVAACEQKLLAAESALGHLPPDRQTRDTLGRIAAIRATMAVSQHEVAAIVDHSRRALEHLDPANLAFRTSTAWKLGYAYQLQGDRAAARQAYDEVIAQGESSGNTIFTIMALIALGSLEHGDNQLHQAFETFGRVLRLLGDQSPPVVCEAYLGLARICYEWNDLDAAHEHAQRGVALAQQLQNSDRVIACDLFLARLALARSDLAGAAALVARAGQLVRWHNFTHQMPDLAAAQALLALRLGDLAGAARLAQKLPLSQARVLLAQGDPAGALAVLEPYRREMDARAWDDERLKVRVLEAVALHAGGDPAGAAGPLGEALALAEPGGLVRVFVDEGRPMARLLASAAALGVRPDAIEPLLAALEAERRDDAPAAPALPLGEPLSQRELEILRLIAEGRSNGEIGERLFLALSTVKGHTRNIFGKLQVQRRTEAVARARELGLI